jgi:hypothetical protein
MPLPLLALLALGGASDAVGALESSAGRKQQEKLTKEQIAADRERSAQSTALQESLANPFRHQAAQASTAGALDRMERASYTPARLSLPSNPYAKYMPQVSGGFSYEKSPELIAAAHNLKGDVLAGHTAPTMTNPMNYGRTAALRLDANGNPMGPTSGGAAGDPNAHPVTELVSSYDRRGKVKGVMGGPGLLQNAVSGRAATAQTDFTVADARDAIARAFTYYQGRQASPQEIDAVLAGQGLKPGDRYVGQGGLLNVLSVIAGNNHG